MKTNSEARSKKYQPINVGDKFGKWTVIGESILVGAKPHRAREWPCRCSCGKEHNVKDGNLKQGTSTRCRSCAVRGLRLSPGDRQRYSLALGSFIKSLEKFTDSQLQQASERLAQEHARRLALHPETHAVTSRKTAEKTEAIQ